MSLYRKSVAALIGGLLTTLGTALSDGNITLTETLAAIGSSLLLAGAVWRVPNTDNTPDDPAPF